LKLVDGFAFGHCDPADFDGEPKLWDVHLNRHGSDTQLGNKGMVARVSTMSGIGHAKDKALVPAH